MALQFEKPRLALLKKNRSLNQQAFTIYRAEPSILKVKDCATTLKAPLGTPHLVGLLSPEAAGRMTRPH